MIFTGVSQVVIRLGKPYFFVGKTHKAKTVFYNTFLESCEEIANLLMTHLF